MNKLLLLCGLLYGAVAVAQDTTKTCVARFEVNAGPEIDVCEVGSVGLSGLLGGDASRGVWRGGKGTFDPNRNTLTAEYTPDSSEYGTTVVLTLVGDNPNYPECPKARDLTRIHVNLQPKVTAGENQKVCQGVPVKLKGRLVSGKAKMLRWTSSGTGTFEDAGKAETVYTPSEVDAGLGALRLTLKAVPFGVCLADSDAVALTLVPSPVVSVPEGLSSRGTVPVSLNAKVEGAAKITWSSDGSGKFQSGSKAQSIYTPSEADLTRGSVVLKISAKAESGCLTEKTFILSLSPGE